MNDIITFDSTTYEQEHNILSMKAIILSIIVSAILPATLYLYHEYLAFKSLGPGGTSQSLAGFLKVFVLSFAKVSNPYELPGSSARPIGCLHDLPSRTGPRPETKGIAPHRQVTQKGNAATYELLVAEIEKLGLGGEDLYIGTSCFEKHSIGLFTSHPVNNTCGGEIWHTHPSDGGSMHLTLHPADVRTVLEAGWGERHPLARGGWFERFVPEGFVIVYAPRDERELEMAMNIVGAAKWFVRGRNGREFDKTDDRT